MRCYLTSFADSDFWINTPVLHILIMWFTFIDSLFWNRFRCWKSFLYFTSVYTADIRLGTRSRLKHLAGPLSSRFIVSPSPRFFIDAHPSALERTWFAKHVPRRRLKTSPHSTLNFIPIATSVTTNEDLKLIFRRRHIMEGSFCFAMYGMIVQAFVFVRR